jgi:hypothetical protein
MLTIQNLDKGAYLQFYDEVTFEDFSKSIEYALGRLNTQDLDFWIADFRSISSLALTLNDIKLLGHRDSVTSAYYISNLEYIFILDETFEITYKNELKVYEEVVENSTNWNYNRFSNVEDCNYYLSSKSIPFKIPTLK